MKTLRSLAICSVVVLAACSGSDADTSTDDSGSPDDSAPAEADVEATTPMLDGDAAAELCPDVAALSTATGVELSEPIAVELAADPLGADSTAGATSCEYGFLDNSVLSVTLHSSPIDTSFLQDLPPDVAAVTDLDSGATQLQFDGVPGCEVYGDRFSVVVLVDSEDIDSCGIASSAHDFVVVS